MKAHPQQGRVHMECGRAHNWNDSRWTLHNERVANTQDSWGFTEDVCISMMITPPVMIALLAITSLLNFCVCSACPRTKTMYVYVHHCRYVTCILKHSSIHGHVHKCGPNSLFLATMMITSACQLYRQCVKNQDVLSCILQLCRHVSLLPKPTLVKFYRYSRLHTHIVSRFHILRCFFTLQPCKHNLSWLLIGATVTPWTYHTPSINCR